MCADYRGLNKDPIKSSYPIPLIEGILDEFHGAKFFPEIDLCQ